MACLSNRKYDDRLAWSSPKSIQRDTEITFVSSTLKILILYFFLQGAEGENAQDAKKDGEEVIHDCESLEKTKDVSESNKDEADMENGGGAEMKKEEDDRNEDHQTGNEREEKNDLAEAGKILAEVDDKGNPAGELEVLTATTVSLFFESFPYMIAYTHPHLLSPGFKANRENQVHVLVEADSCG